MPKLVRSQSISESSTQSQVLDVEFLAKHRPKTVDVKSGPLNVPKLLKPSWENRSNLSKTMSEDPKLYQPLYPSQRTTYHPSTQVHNYHQCCFTVPISPPFSKEEQGQGVGRSLEQIMDTEPVARLPPPPLARPASSSSLAGGTEAPAPENPGRMVRNHSNLALLIHAVNHVTHQVRPSLDTRLAESDTRNLSLARPATTGRLDRRFEAGHSITQDQLGWNKQRDDEVQTDQEPFGSWLRLEIMPNETIPSYINRFTTMSRAGCGDLFDGTEDSHLLCVCLFIRGLYPREPTYHRLCVNLLPRLRELQTSGASAELLFQELCRIETNTSWAMSFFDTDATRHDTMDGFGPNSSDNNVASLNGSQGRGHRRIPSTHQISPESHMRTRFEADHAGPSATDKGPSFPGDFRVPAPPI